MKQQFTITGFHCEACTKITAKKISKIDGVVDVVCDLTTGLVTTTSNREVSKNEINEALKNTEYKAL